LVNVPKSELEAKQLIKYVGTLYELEIGLAIAPVERLVALESLISQILNQGGATARMWARLIWKMG
jgi:hypothetical protein